MSFCFALTRPDRPHTSRILTVNKFGSLRVTPILDSAHHCWSSRGYLAIPTNDSIRLHTGIHAGQVTSPVEPWDVTFSEEDNQPSSATTLEDTTPDFLEDDRTGRPRLAPPRDLQWPTMAMPSSNSSLSATRPGKTMRTFSPAAMRRYALVRPRSGSRTPKQTSEIDASSPFQSPTQKPIGLPDLEDKQVAALASQGDLAQLKGRAPDPTDLPLKALRDDISKVMWNRTRRGYGLENVRTPSFPTYAGQFKMTLLSE